MNETKDENPNTKPNAKPNAKPNEQARMIFGALVLLVFVWFGLFFILPTITGKPGIAQNIQLDLQANPEDK